MLVFLRIVGACLVADVRTFGIGSVRGSITEEATSMPKQIHVVPSAPAPVGPYSVAAEASGFVFLSGQVGIDPTTGSIVPGGVTTQTRQIMENIGVILTDLDLGYADIVKTTIFLDDMDDFASVNAVYGEFVGESKPARSTVAVAGLPLGVAVEIEVVAAR
jgi:2-iminobutanoate/2-iminopropanoate deaminase